MATLILRGGQADVELITDDTDGQIIAKCLDHPGATGTSGQGCAWTERHDDLNDAAEYAADHADRGTW